MKTIVTAILVLLCAVSFAQKKYAPIKKKKPKIDSLMIKRTGADPYGMKKYVLCILKTGPNAATLPKDSVKMILAGHMKNMNVLESQGKLVVAGPFTDGTDWEGVFVFNVTTVEEAKKLTETDPGVQTGLFSAELHPWYSSAVLMEVPLLHKKVQVKSF